MGHIRGSWPSLFIAGLFFFLALPQGIRAVEAEENQPCPFTCEVSFPAACGKNVAAPFSFRMIPSDPNCPVYLVGWYMDFGNGQVITQDSGGVGATFYTSPGTYNWEFFYNAQFNSTCTVRGSIVISECALTVKVKAIARPGIDPPVVDFTAQPSQTGCDCAPQSAYFAYYWNFYAGEWGQHVGTSQEQNPTFTFPFSNPSLAWSLVVTWMPSNNRVSASGNVSRCLKVGSLTICAESMTADTANHLYTFTGNPNINERLFFDGTVTFEGDPLAGEGLLKTDGKIQAGLRNGLEVIAQALQDSDLAYDLDGSDGTLTPAPSNPAEYLADIAGLRLETGDRPITITDDGVKIEPTVFAGAGQMALFSFKLSVLYRPGFDKQLLGAEILMGKLSPGLSFMNMALDYNPTTNIITGTVGVNFPFLGQWGVTMVVDLKFNCLGYYAGINRVELTLAWPEELPIGTTGLTWAGFTSKVDNFCDWSKFSIGVGFDLAMLGVDDDVLSVVGVGGGYKVPGTVVINGGTVTFVGFPLASVGGTISWRPGFAGLRVFGKANLAQVFQANLQMGLNVTTLRFTGSADGTITIPYYQCGWANVPCRMTRSMITSVVSLPFTTGMFADMMLGRYPNGWEGGYRGRVQVGPVGLAVVLMYMNGDLVYLVGTNYENVIGILRTDCKVTPQGTERSVDLPSPQEQVLFGVAANEASAALPAITLKTPQGDTITPDNWGSFPGVHYTADEAEKLSFFRVDTAGPGIWTLGVSNLSDAEVTFQVLMARTPPSIAFTSVQKLGETLLVNASVSPASEHTKVTFLCSRDPEGLDVEWYSAELPATAGTAGATWNTAGIPSGSYTLRARADDGMNPATVVVFDEPITVDAGLVLPPTGVTGTRTETAATVRWTPSGTPTASMYQVLYTDALDKPGYPWVESAALPTEFLMEGLDAAKDYRFCVVAFDGDGNRSLESAPWIGWRPGSVPGDCDGDGTVSIGEVQKAINMFLGTLAPGCGVDCNGNGTVSIGEVQKVINAFLGMASSCS
jgi:hypothetical protein